MPPAVGRYFTSRDVEADERVVVLSHSLWQVRFGRDRSIVGRQIRMGGEAFTVVGVAPAAYALTDPARVGVLGGFSSQLWTPLTFSGDQRSNFGSHYLGVLAKLKSGVSLARAQADLERVTRGIAERHPKQMEGRGVAVLSLKEELVGNVRPQLVVLLAAVGFVLLICCVNIASLLTARSTARRREVAIRAAIGGDRLRIVRQLLTESAVIACAGGLVSLVVAWLGIDFLVRSGPEALPRLHEAGLQLDVLLFAVAITGVAAVVSGLAPAIRASRADLQNSLRDGRRAAVNGGVRDRMRTALVVAEIAMVAVLLVGTGLLVRSAEKLRHVPLGFDAHDSITARVTLPAVRYPNDETVANAYRLMLESLRGTRGIRYAAAATNIPLMGGNADAATVAEGKPMALTSAPSPFIRLVTDEYFEAIGMTMARGQSFQPDNMTAGTGRVVVVNERLAAALWPGENAVGKRLSTWAKPDDPEWREVIGVVRDTRSSGQRASVPMELFIPYTQAPIGAWNAFQRSMVLVVRTSEGWPETYVPLMRRAVRDVDASIPLYDVRTMENIFVDLTASRRFYMRLVLVLAATGLGLAMLGIYGVIAYFVTVRTSEIGLRLAMGAERGEVTRMVIGHSIRTALIGIAIGVPAALMLTHVMTSLLYEVAPTDPMTFVAVAVLLVVTSLIAAAIPSARAARVDPLVALRYE
jgi:putative ABC transport system permease protein